MIKAGDAQVVVCGGSENMSAAPYLLPSMRFGARLNDSQVIDSLIHDGLQDAFSGEHMGLTAERVAAQFKISRQVQDEFALASQLCAESSAKKLSGLRVLAAGSLTTAKLRVPVKEMPPRPESSSV